MNRHSILIAEDDADDRYLMKTALEETGISGGVISGTIFCVSSCIMLGL